MELNDLTEQIIERVYHGAILHDDPYTQERIVASDVYNLLQEWEDERVHARITLLEEKLEGLGVKI